MGAGAISDLFSYLGFLTLPRFLECGKGLRALRPENAPPTKVTQICKNNSCVISLNETDKENRDRHYL